MIYSSVIRGPTAEGYGAWNGGHETVKQGPQSEIRELKYKTPKLYDIAILDGLQNV